jgi:hypothetical protein
MRTNCSTLLAEISVTPTVMVIIGNQYGNKPTTVNPKVE